MRRIDDAWTKQMKRVRKIRKIRKRLVLIGIVCDDEIKDIINFERTKDKSNMVFKIRFV